MPRRDPSARRSLQLFKHLSSAKPYTDAGWTARTPPQAGQQRPSEVGDPGDEDRLEWRSLAEICNVQHDNQYRLRRQRHQVGDVLAHADKYHSAHVLVVELLHYRKDNDWDTESR